MVSLSFSWSGPSATGDPPTDARDAHLRALWSRGFAVAYRMLGSIAEAEDVAQEALLRLAGQGEAVDEPAAWVTTVATRLSINVLKSARARRVQYVGPWLPEPLIEDAASDPASRAERADSLSLAVLVLLERLNPLERAAYLLREMFDYAYGEIAGIIERPEVSCRQLVARARKHLDAGRSRFDADETVRDALLESFLAAAERGDMDALEELLAEDAVLYVDTGGNALGPQDPIVGATAIARFLTAVAHGRRASEAPASRPVTVNGQVGRLLLGPPLPEPSDRLSSSARPHLPARQSVSVLTVDVLDARIHAIRVMRNPDKLPRAGLSQIERPSCQRGEPHPPDREET